MAYGVAANKNKKQSIKKKYRDNGKLLSITAVNKNIQEEISYV
jgi:hypothetical protein